MCCCSIADAVLYFGSVGVICDARISRLDNFFSYEISQCAVCSLLARLLWAGYFYSLVMGVSGLSWVEFESNNQRPPVFLRLWLVGF
jgi:hypothetical protein